MLYVASDLHGEYALFIELLNKIRFSKNDTMIVCGDIIDKGPDSVRLAKLIFAQSNIRCILGNHEFEFLKLYWSLMKNTSNDFDLVLKKLQDYFPNDGQLLNWDIVDAIEMLPAYIEERDFICVHAGAPLDCNSMVTLNGVSVEQLVYDRRFKEPNVLPQNSKCIFFGHTPARYVSGRDNVLCYTRVASPRKIDDYCKIHLDMGTMLSGVMACFCVDTLEAYYVRRVLR